MGRCELKRLIKRRRIARIWRTLPLESKLTCQQLACICDLHLGNSVLPSFLASRSNSRVTTTATGSTADPDQTLNLQPIGFLYSSIKYAKGHKINYLFINELWTLKGFSKS